MICDLFQITKGDSCRTKNCNPDLLPSPHKYPCYTGLLRITPICYLHSLFSVYFLHTGANASENYNAVFLFCGFNL